MDLEQKLDENEAARVQEGLDWEHRVNEANERAQKAVQDILKRHKESTTVKHTKQVEVAKPVNVIEEAAEKPKELPGRGGRVSFIKPSPAANNTEETKTLAEPAVQSKREEVPTPKPKTIQEEKYPEIEKAKESVKLPVIKTAAPTKQFTFKKPASPAKRETNAFSQRSSKGRLMKPVDHMKDVGFNSNHLVH